MYPWNFTKFSNILLEILVPNLVSLTRPSFQILDKTQVGVFSNSGFLVNPLYCNYSRTSNDIDVKRRPVTKLYKRNKATLKKFDDDVTSANCDVTIIFPVFGQFGAIWKPHPDA